jgi:hypothetical protein
MLAKLSAYPVDPGIDVAIVFLVVVGMLAVVYVVDWLRH